MNLIEPSGRIKRIAAAVLVDDVVESKDDSGKVVEAHRKRTPEEMKQIEEVAKAALGWDTGRGDQISVQNIPFQIPESEKPVPPSLPDRVRIVTERWTGLLRYVGVFALFLLVYVLLLKPVKTRVLAAIDATPANVAAAQSQLGAGDSAMLAGSEYSSPALGAMAGNPQLQRAAALQQQMVLRVKSDPDSATRPVQGWLRGGRA